MNHLPLAGITVVALEQAVAAPFATRQLADLGARVIKIERPSGDFARGYDRTVHGQSSYFVWLNRGKESVVLDVKDPADRSLLGAMIDQADVFVQNLIPGAAARLGLDAGTLRGADPRLIHCSISGYGEDGPYASKKAYGGSPPLRTGARHPSISPYGPFLAADGSVFFGIQNEREWLVLCRDILGRPGLATEPRFASNPDRIAHHDELTAIIESSFADRTAEEVSRALEAAGIANARLRAPADLAEHPQLLARDRWRTVGTPGGEIDALLPPVEMSGVTPVMGAVPALGEHTEAIRAEFAPDA